MYRLGKEGVIEVSLAARLVYFKREKGAAVTWVLVCGSGVMQGRAVDWNADRNDGTRDWGPRIYVMMETSTR